MKQIEIKLLAELLKDSSKSDREIARVLGVSQPTVSRTRTKLERNRVIREYTIIPDATQLGFELMAITVGRFKIPRDKKIHERSVPYMKEIPNIIFSSTAQGMGKDAFMISLHRNFTEYENFIVKAKEDWIDAIEDIDSILISLKGFNAKPFSLKYLGEILDPSKAKS